jgi:Asp/Glu/hydantoin racemase
VVGTDGGREFTRVMIDNELTMDVAAAEADIVDAGRKLVQEHAGIGAILLECTNMVPYARTLRDELGIPVHDIYSFMTWFHAGLAPRDFGHPGRNAQSWRER